MSNVTGVQSDGMGRWRGGGGWIFGTVEGSGGWLEANNSPLTAYFTVARICGRTRPSAYP